MAIVAQQAVIVSTLQAYPADQQVARVTYMLRDKTYASAAENELLLALQKTRNIPKYVEFCKLLHEARGAAGSPGGSAPVPETLSSGAVMDLEKTISNDLGRLQQAKGVAESALQKEGIRSAMFDLVRFYFSMGDHSSVTKNLARSRDLCTTAAQVIEWGTLGVTTSLFSHQGKAVGLAAQYLARMEDPSVLDNASDDEFLSVRLWGLLIAFDRKEYGQVVQRAISLRKKRESVIDVKLNVSSFLNTRDLLAMIVLSVLSLTSRADVTAVAACTDLKTLFETHSNWRQVIDAFSTADFATAQVALQSLAKELFLDMFLGPHVGSLLGTIKQRAIQQYVQPFETLDLSHMANAFRASVDDVEHDLAVLIGRGLIHARIDRARNVLHATQTDLKSAAYQRALESGDSFVHDAVLAMRVANLQLAHIVVPAPPNRGTMSAMMMAM